VWSVAAGAIALLIATPIVVILSSLATPSLEVWRHLWHTYLLELVWNTLVLVAGVGVGVLVLGVGLAWLVSRYRFPGRPLFAWLLILPMAMPAYVMGFVFLAIFDYAGPVQRTWRWALGPKTWFPDIASPGGVVLVMTLVLYPYVYLLTRTAFSEQPAGPVEMARSLGLGERGVLWRVMLPLARPSIAAGLALALMEALADFGTVGLYGYSTFTVAIYRVWFGLFNREAAAELAAALLCFTFGLLFLERRMRGRARFSQIGGGRPLPPRVLMGWRAWAASAVCGGVILAAFVVPVMQLLYWALSSLGGPATDARYPIFLLNTLMLAGVAALTAVAAAVVLAYSLRLSRSVMLSFLTRFAGMGYALPGSVIAVGVLLPLAWLDHTLDALLRQRFGVSSGLLLTGSVAGLVFAYLVRFLAVSAQTLEAGLGQIAPGLDAAARSLGAGPSAVLRRIHLPLLRGSMGCAALLVFVEVMKEMPATLLLRPFGYDTLAVRIWQLTSESFWEAAALPALTIVAGGILPVLLLFRQSSPAGMRRRAMRARGDESPGA
jgi:iron(III) transport system permease protein